jgi:hypothetical protein
LKSTKYQYSIRLDLPLNTAYFFTTPNETRWWVR